MQRREFITLLGGAAALAACSACAAARADAAHRRAPALSAADDPQAQARVAAFLQELQQLGWTIGRNVRIDTRLGRRQCQPTFANMRPNWPR